MAFRNSRPDLSDMVQALIKGSGFLNATAKNSMTQISAPNRGSNTSPTRLPGSSSSYFGPQAGVAPPELPAEFNFQHVVRGRSPTSELSQLADSEESVAVPVLQSAAAKSSPHKGNISTPATGNQGVKATAALHSQKLPTNAVHQNLEATPANSSWQKLVSLSDNYDR